MILSAAGIQRARAERLQQHPESSLEQLHSSSVQQSTAFGFSLLHFVYSALTICSAGCVGHSQQSRSLTEDLHIGLDVVNGSRNAQGKLLRPVYHHQAAQRQIEDLALDLRKQSRPSPPVAAVKPRRSKVRAIPHHHEHHEVTGQPGQTLDVYALSHPVPHQSSKSYYGKPSALDRLIIDRVHQAIHHGQLTQQHLESLQGVQSATALLERCKTILAAERTQSPTTFATEDVPRPRPLHSSVFKTETPLVRRNTTDAELLLLVHELDSSKQTTYTHSYSDAYRIARKAMPRKWDETISLDNKDDSNGTWDNVREAHTAHYQDLKAKHLRKKSTKALH